MSSALDFDDTPEGAPSVPRSAASIQSAEVRKIRSSHDYLTLRSQFRFSEQHRWEKGKAGAPCWLCGTDIDYRLEYPHPYSWSLDHAVSVKENPGLIKDVNNFRSSHLDCNTHRGTDAPKLSIGEPSEVW
jgi:hypothetical protein